MQLHLLTEDDADALWHFEVTHRAYFERWVTARPGDFYTPEGFDQAMKRGLLLQASGQAFHYLIKEAQTIVGRINLLQVRHDNLHSAQLAYRVAPPHEGLGQASAAVASIMEKAFQTHRLKRLEAAARPENPAAIRVLVKNGFQQFGHSHCSFELHRQWFDLLYFEAHAPDMRAQCQGAMRAA